MAEDVVVLKTEEVVVTEGLGKHYPPEAWVLKDAKLNIKRGEWVTIMGPSGSGKTTLLNMLSCLDTPSAGTVALAGTEITKMNQNQLTRFRRENIGLIFQQYHLVPYLTALENIMMSQYFHSIVAEEDAKEALEKVGLGHRVDHLPAHLSGGEQQRVCIARALINEPKILMADEPTGNLDQKSGNMVLDLIGKLHKEGHTIVLVTHNPKVAELGDRIIRLLDGMIVEDIMVNAGSSPSMGAEDSNKESE